MGDPKRALENYNKALEIRQKALPLDHRDLADSYNNIGVVYQRMGEHTRALENFNKALQIRQKTLSADHPDFAASYNNTGLVYSQTGEHTRLHIRHKSLWISTTRHFKSDTNRFLPFIPTWPPVTRTSV